MIVSSAGGCGRIRVRAGWWLCTALGQTKFVQAFAPPRITPCGASTGPWVSRRVMRYVIAASPRLNRRGKPNPGPGTGQTLRVPPNDTKRSIAPQPSNAIGRLPRKIARATRPASAALDEASKPARLAKIPMVEAPSA